jgi:ElaB/YqjD/DUF883 family membrane-anchored ribosome-binding protein
LDEQEQNMSNKDRIAGNPTGDNAGTMAGDLSQRTKKAAASITDIAGDAAAAVDNSRSAAADGLDTAAAALHDSADRLPGGDTVRNAARATADRLSASADYVRTHDTKRVIADLETFVKTNPGPAIAVAAAFGFLLGRALSRD